MTFFSLTFDLEFNSQTEWLYLLILTISFEFVCTLFATMAENDSNGEVNTRIDHGLQIGTILTTLALISMSLRAWSLLTIDSAFPVWNKWLLELFSSNLYPLCLQQLRNTIATMKMTLGLTIWFQIGFLFYMISESAVAFHSERWCWHLSINGLIDFADGSRECSSISDVWEGFPIGATFK